jgi:hypothetical protein
VWNSFDVICREEWEGVGRNIDGVKIVKKGKPILLRQ